MEKIDRLGWAAGIAFSSYGVRVGIRTNDAAALPRLLPLLPPHCRPLRSSVISVLYSLRVAPPSPRPGVRNYHLLYGFEQKVARTMDFQALLNAFETDLKVYIALRSPKRV